MNSNNPLFFHTKQHKEDFTRYPFDWTSMSEINKPLVGCIPISSNRTLAIEMFLNCTYSSFPGSRNNALESNFNKRRAARSRRL